MISEYNAFKGKKKDAVSRYFHIFDQFIPSLTSNFSEPMIPVELEDTTVFTFENLSLFPEITHFVSTRAGGVSEKNFSSLNTGFHVGDDNFRVSQNRRILANSLGIALEKFTLANQCHSANVAIVDGSGRGRGAFDKTDALPNTDGLITSVSEICLGVQVADCVPILLYDPKNRVIAALHAGWKGTIRKIASEAVSKMLRHYGSRAENIYAGLGPSNGPCCYEVGGDVCREAIKAFGTVKDIIMPAKEAGKYIFDQWKANFRLLTEAGIKPDHIEVSEICTQCRSEQFFSNRALEGVSGRFMAGIMLKKVRQH